MNNVETLKLPPEGHRQGLVWILDKNGNMCDIHTVDEFLSRRPRCKEHRLVTADIRTCPECKIRMGNRKRIVFRESTP